MTLKHAHTGIHDGYFLATKPDRCLKCGHLIGARCSVCGRELVCGHDSEPCPNIGCLERVIADRYGGRDADLESGPLENPTFT